MVNSNGTGFTILHHFKGGDGAAPVLAPVIGPGKVLYGVTSAGGDERISGVLYGATMAGHGYHGARFGAVFSYDPATGVYTNVTGVTDLALAGGSPIVSGFGPDAPCMVSRLPAARVTAEHCGRSTSADRRPSPMSFSILPLKMDPPRRRHSVPAAC
jgi:hypothetical protein